MDSIRKINNSTITLHPKLWVKIGGIRVQEVLGQELQEDPKQTSKAFISQVNMIVVLREGADII